MTISVYTSYNTYPYKNKNDEYYVDKPTYRKIIKTINEVIFKYLLTTGAELSLPYKLGKFQIVKIKGTTKNKGLWFKKKVKAKFTNFHTDGYIAKFIWFKKKARVKNKFMWTFKLARTNKRKNLKDYERLNMHDYIINNGVEHFIEL
ncbi:MAG: hypothetical protein KatS3mg002_1394 [Candidatus Woesearchaeota archaeon]|nr:MAG: hypothetical protein KatS3mg002_1394 [Candidatus Woesearchaeota archaeon]